MPLVLAPSRSELEGEGVTECMGMDALIDPRLSGEEWKQVPWSTRVKFQLVGPEGAEDGFAKARHRRARR